MKTRPLQTSFSTADASEPELHSVGGRLLLRFKDWRERYLHVTFHDVIGFKWVQMHEGLLMDDACEVIDSAWLHHLLKADAMPPDSGHRHLCFNFNACGQLDVICTGFVEEW